MLQAVSNLAPMMFSRYSDGARPVRILGEHAWEVDKDGRATTFTTAQALLAELTGHPTGRHWSLDRYFKKGKHAPIQAPGVGDVLDLFPVEPQPVITLLEPLAPPILAFRVPDTSITLPRETRLQGKNLRKRSVRKTKTVSGLIISGPVGIDLANRGHEVRKLLFAGFGRRIFSAGYDPDDVLQEVYKGLLARNKGTCPWDPSKSSFGHYVYMVCSCVLSNYHRKQTRRRMFEQIGLPSYQDGQYAYRDAASNTTVPARETADHAGYLLNEAADDLVDYILALPRGTSTDARLAIDVLPYVASGTPRVSIAAALQVSMAAVSRAVSFLRRAALGWRAMRAL